MTVDALPAAGGEAGSVKTATPFAGPYGLTIVRRPPRKSAQRLAKVFFESQPVGAAFRCKLDKGEFKACASPLKKSVKPGRHVLTVVAINPDGSATPARTVRWTVTKPTS